MVGGALVDGLLGCELAALERLRAIELVVGELDAGGRRLQRRLGLLQPDLVGARVNYKKQIALMDDLAVLEVDFGQCPADLGTQFDPVDRRELAEKAGPGVDFAPQGFTDRDRHRRRRQRDRLVSLVTSKTEIEPRE